MEEIGEKQKSNETRRVIIMYDTYRVFKNALGALDRSSFLVIIEKIP